MSQSNNGVEAARRELAERAKSFKESATQALRTAADSIRRESSKSQNEDMAKQAEQLAHRMDQAANYLDTHSLEDIGEDVTRVVRANPWRALGVALFAGIVIGLTIAGRRD